MSTLRSFCEHEGEIPLPIWNKVLLILGFNVTLYFHNTSVDQYSYKSRGTKYQFHIFGVSLKVVPLLKNAPLHKSWSQPWGLYVNFHLQSPSSLP
jgi:hypothetical protein